MRIANMILELIKLSESATTGDLQGRSEAMAIELLEDSRMKYKDFPEIETLIVGEVSNVLLREAFNEKEGG